jgi:hypothetical protein
LIKVNVIKVQHLLEGTSSQAVIRASGKTNAPKRAKVTKLKTKLHGLCPRANYTDRATAACWQSDCQLLRIEGAMWSV